MFQHTAARRRLRLNLTVIFDKKMFQHTAARRRLQYFVKRYIRTFSFNTQPRGGGCFNAAKAIY